MFENQEKFWKNKIDKIPDEKLIEWVSEFFPGSTDIHFYRDEECGHNYLNWINDTLCGSVNLNDPDVWLVLKVWEYFENE